MVYLMKSFRWINLFAAFVTICVVNMINMIMVSRDGFCSQPAPRPPNFVIIFLDDSGWTDFRPFGETDYPTVNVEKLAKEGCRYIRFYVPQAICSASRSALMTGCYPGRTKMVGAHPPRARGLDPQFATLAEVLKPQGYKTAVFGKWHLGDQNETRPPARGFDESCGLMVSNDMWKFHPESRNFDQWPLQFWNNGTITIEDVTPSDQKNLTAWYTEHAVSFIERHKSEPFFLYVPHSMPHVPIFCSKRFEGKSGKGLYADVMMELDWSVGEILQSLEKAGVADDTVVLFTSDNGPWISYGNHAGNTPFRESKGTIFDGGIRSACIMRYPRAISPETVSEKLFSSIDLLPTFANLAGATLPTNTIDGKNVWDLLTGKAGATNPHEYYCFSTGDTFEGMISGDGRWKFHLAHDYRVLVQSGQDGTPGTYARKRIEMSLFDIKEDPHELTNVLETYPDVASTMQRYAEAHKTLLYATSKKSSND